MRGNGKRVWKRKRDEVVTLILYIIVIRDDTLLLLKTITRYKYGKKKFKNILYIYIYR